MPIPNFEAIMLPLLKHIADGQEHSMQKLISILAEQFHLNESEKKQLLPSGRQTAFENRAAWAKFYLQKACLIESPKRGIFQITDRGRNVLKQSPSEITNDFLMQFTEFAKFKKSSKSIIDDNNAIKEYPEIPEPQNPEYSLSNCAEDTGFEEAELKRWVSAIGRKNQAIFYGSPGTGKTFITEKIAQHLISDSDSFSELIQFHPAYTYEDFIQGIRPQNQDGQLTYSIVPGRFLEFCKKAESCDGICVLIIDEINRANLAQVFGELMYLLEYRDKEIPLAGGNTFRIPSNVHIIGTMNTADRSIALVDHALRRRFAFIEIRPNYDVLRNYHERRNTGFAVDGLIQVLQKLNFAIADKNYELGISFFLTEKLAEDIEDIWKMEIEPYLEEYFFDRLEKVDEFRWNKIEKQVLP